MGGQSQAPFSMPHESLQTLISITGRATCRQWRRTRRSQDGFALIVAIWGIGLLALLFVTYTAAARYRSIEALQLAERARAESAATAAINIAILDLLAFASGEALSGRFRRDGSPVLCTLANGQQVAIAVTDEGGKVDLNTADPALIEALVRRLRPDGDQGRQVAADILRLRRAAVEAQSARGIASPDAAAFRTVLEMDQVSGVDKGLFHAMAPLTTVHSGRTGIDAQVAPAELLQALQPGGVVSRAGARIGLPSDFVSASPGATFLISSEAMSATGARFTRDALVMLSTEAGPDYRIIEWRRGTMRAIDRAQAGLPAC